MKTNKYTTLILDIFIFSLGTVLAKVVQFLLMPLYTSYMTTAAFGDAELVNNLSELFFPIATLCIYEGGFRFAVEKEIDDKEILECIFRVLSISLLIGLFITLVSYFAFDYQYAFLLYFILYAYSLRMCLAYYCRGKGLVKEFSFSGVLNALSLSVLNILFLVVLKLEVLGYLVSIGLSYLISSFYLMWKAKIIKTITEKNNDIESTNKVFKLLITYSLPLIFYNVMYWFTTISGRYVLSFFESASEVGVYIAAIKISAIVNMIQQAIFAAFQLNSSQNFEEKGKEDYYSTVINFGCILYIFFGILVIGFSPILARFTLKKEFIVGEVYLPIILLAAILNCLSSLIGTMYTTYKETKSMIGVSLVGAIINVGIGVLLTPVLGIWGVCIASVLCYFSQLLYKIIDVSRFATLNYKKSRLFFNIFILSIQVLGMWLFNEFTILLCMFCISIFLVVNLKEVIKLIKSLKIIVME